MLSPADKAKELEKEARSKKRAAVAISDESRQYTKLLEAAQTYEQAGNAWMRELTASRGYERKMGYARKNAQADYALGREIRTEMKDKGLGKKLVAAIAMISLLGALASISMNLTGNAIGGSLENNSWISIGLFFLGCAFTLFYFRLRENSASKKKKRR